MIAVSEIETPEKLRATGLRLLNEELGEEKTQEFIDLCFDGWGDSLAEKKAQPPWTDADHAEAMEFIKANSGITEAWRGVGV